MWGRKTVAAIFPVSETKKYLIDSIEKFDATGYIDEVIVVSGDLDNDLREQIKENRAKLIQIDQFSQGQAIRTGINSTKADLMIIVEPNDAFAANDVAKLLAYSDDFDTVFGSRVYVPLIEGNSKMHLPRRLANSFLGKLISLLFLSQPITDIGCVLRLTNRKGWNKVDKDCHSNGEMFIVEWLLSSVKNKVRFMEIPINFNTPKGESTYSSSYLGLGVKGLLITLYIGKFWFSYLLNEKSIQSSRKTS